MTANTGLKQIATQPAARNAGPRGYKPLDRVHPLAYHVNREQALFVVDVAANRRCTRFQQEFVDLMACCIFGALIIAQILAFGQRVAESRRMIWLLTSIFAGFGLVSFGASQMAITMSRYDMNLSQALAWCLGGRS